MAGFRSCGFGFNYLYNLKDKDLDLAQNQHGFQVISQLMQLCVLFFIIIIVEVRFE